MFTEILDALLVLGLKTITFTDKIDKQPSNTNKHNANSNKDFLDKAYKPNSRR